MPNKKGAKVGHAQGSEVWGRNVGSIFFGINTCRGLCSRVCRWGHNSQGRW